jgi:predicted dehydrogenase
MRPYHSQLSPRGVHNHFPNWRAYREFGGGMVTDWGAHHLDIAQWGLGADDGGPVEILPPEKPGAKRGARLVYANGVVVEHKDGIGAHFYGTEGEVLVDRGRFALKRGGETIASILDRNEDRKTSCAAQVQKAERAFLKDSKIKLYDSKNHIGDFTDAVEARTRPITSEQVGGRSAICCHLMNLAYWHGQKLKWDPATFTFVGGTGNPAWLTRNYRGPWSV